MGAADGLGATHRIGVGAVRFLGRTAEVRRPALRIFFLGLRYKGVKPLKVSNMPKLPSAPKGLTPRSRKLWQAVVLRYARSPGKQALLEQALRALDRADEAAAAVLRDGMTIVTERSGVSHIHPLLKAEQAFRQQFISAWSKMGLAHDASDTPFSIGMRDLKENVQ